MNCVSGKEKPVLSFSSHIDKIVVTQIHYHGQTNVYLMTDCKESHCKSTGHHHSSQVGMHNVAGKKCSFKSSFLETAKLGHRAYGP